MRKQFKIFLITTFLIFSQSQVQAQSSHMPANASTGLAEVKEHSARTDTRASTSESGMRSEELLVLRTQNKLIQEFQGSLLTTVLWALGVVCTIAVFTAGFGWWSNLKVYENDKKRLKEELDTSLGERIAQLELRLSSSGSDLARAIEAKAEGIVNRAHGDLLVLQSRVNELSTKLDGTFAQLAEAKRDNLRLQSALRRVEETVWETKEIPENVLLTQCQALEAELEAELTAFAQWTLQRMKKVLQESFIDKNQDIDRTTVDTVLETLPTNNSDLGIHVVELKGLIAKLTIVEDETV